VEPAEYDAWYRTPRGSWIGESEFRLLWRLIEPQPGERLLDIGCGTGYFSRRFAAEGLPVTGLDPDPDMLAYARARAQAGEEYRLGDARSLPFADGAFDLSIAVTSLCFMSEEQQAIREILRVTRRRFALGLLNRHSLLYWEKGRQGGCGAYRGARWHTPREARTLLVGFPVENVRVCTAIALPSGSPVARSLERWSPPSLPWGGFLAIAGEIAH
jgi:SAM-dependent methyltransferase